MRHNGKPFTTKDKDNDEVELNCAKQYYGAWWYERCHDANLNGLYNNTETGRGVVWRQFGGYDSTLKRTVMKIRPFQ